MVKAASTGDSIENTAKLLKNIPTANDIRYHLNKINNFEELGAQINQALKSRIPLGLKNGCLKIAIDLNLICYYGKPTSSELPYIYRSEAKSGTNSFYAYATLYVIINNKLVTLAIRGVRQLDLWIVCKYRKGKRNKHGVQYFVYVADKVKTNLNYIYQDYRKRFGIETSYRLKNICRIKTNNKNPVLRLLFIGISFLLVNIWVNILWLKISRKRKGSRLIYRRLFTLKQMLAFLSQALQRKYQVVESIYIPSG